MHATIYERGQMVIPAKVRKAANIHIGDVFSISLEEGRIVLVRLEKPKRPAPVKTRFVKRKGRHTVADTGIPITSEQVKVLLADFP